MTTARRRPIVCVDFDGVIHDYKHGWEGSAETISGDVVPGFFEWAEKAAQHFKLVIYSSRSASGVALKAMQDWLCHQWAKHAPGRSVHDMAVWFEFSAEKPPAFVTIDDRGLRFMGDWSAPDLQPETLLQFKPWNVK